MKIGDVFSIDAVNVINPVYYEIGTYLWYALRLRAQREFQVKASLDALGVETFLPTWSEDVRWTDRIKTTVRPLFPGYVFARLARPELTYALRVRGVVQILPNSFKPEPIPENEIESVRVVAASKLALTACEYSTGDVVTIDSGPLAGVSGIVTRTKGAMRVVVSVEILHRAVSVELDANTLLRSAERA